MHTFEEWTMEGVKNVQWPNSQHTMCTPELQQMQLGKWQSRRIATSGLPMSCFHYETHNALAYKFNNSTTSTDP